MGDSNSKQMTVETELGDVVVHKMALADYAELLRALKTMPGNLGKLFAGSVDIKKMADTDFMAMLPEILADSWKDLGDVLAVATDKDGTFIMGLDAADGLDLIDAVLQVNDIPRIVASVKKMLARRANVATVASQVQS